MPKPVLLTVDDDPEVLRAIERDLRSRYADRYRVMRANSGSACLATLRELKARNNPVALLLADQRMPQMDGVNFLSEAMEMHPLAKRALLTAYADTNAAIDAINEARVHYYLMKPWDPPEEKLFPALDDLLHEWTSAFRPPYEGIRVLGTRWSNRSYELRDFLARNQVPYQWIDVELAESDPEVRGLRAKGIQEAAYFRVAFGELHVNPLIRHLIAGKEIAQLVRAIGPARAKYADALVRGAKCGGPFMEQVVQGG